MQLATTHTIRPRRSFVPPLGADNRSGSFHWVPSTRERMISHVYFICLCELQRPSEYRQSGRSSQVTSFTGRGTFPKPSSQVLPLDRFGNLHPLQDGPFVETISDVLHAHYEVCMFRSNAADSRRPRTNRTRDIMFDVPEYYHAATNDDNTPTPQSSPLRRRSPTRAESLPSL